MIRFLGSIFYLTFTLHLIFFISFSWESYLFDISYFLFCEKWLYYFLKHMALSNHMSSKVLRCLS